MTMWPVIKDSINQSHHDEPLNYGKGGKKNDLA